ncbi:MAG: response regulator, partial [Flavisolibacter sp.]
MISNKLSISNLIFCEDDDDDRFLFNDVLQEMNSKLKVDFVANGVRLMELLKHYVPDLLFLDLEMPFKNGLECLVEIRSNPKLKDLP